jgi:hypothetical protein
MKQYFGYLGRNYENLSLDFMRENNSLMISIEQSDFISLKDVKSCLMLLIHILKEGMKQYLGYFSRNYETSSFDSMTEYNSLMTSSEQSDFCIINRSKIISDGGNSSSEGSNETIFRLFRSQL